MGNVGMQRRQRKASAASATAPAAKMILNTTLPKSGVTVGIIVLSKTLMMHDCCGFSAESVLFQMPVTWLLVSQTGMSTTLQTAL